MSDDPTSRLICAVSDGNVGLAKALIETFGFSHSTAWSSGYNLLCVALQNEQEEITKLLLSSGSDVNSKIERPSMTPLHLAIENRYTEIVSMLLDRHANVDARNCSNDTPLHCAIERSCPEIVKLLLKRGADIDARTMFGMSALHHAVKIGHLATVEELLNHGANIDASCTESWTNGYAALHYAAHQGDEAMVKLLLTRGAYVNSKAMGEKTPLYVATESSHEKIVNLLLENDANVDIRDENGKTVLQVAVEKAHLPTVKNILHFQPNVSRDVNPSSLYAAVKGPTAQVMQKTVEALLSYGLAVREEDAKNEILLHASVEQGYVKVVKALLKFGADVNTLHRTKKGVTLLHSAALYRQFKITKLLLSRGANVNAKDDFQKSALCYAIDNNDTSITKLLLNGGVNAEDIAKLLHTAVTEQKHKFIKILLRLAPNMVINARGESGRTALHCAAQIEGWDASAEMVEMLLARGALVNAETRDGTTPLHVAATGCKVPVIKVLLESGANVNARQSSGISALHIVSKGGHSDVVQFLVEWGADLDVKDMEGSTPLHTATINGLSNVVRTLLDLGASIEAKDTLGRTALHIAAKHGKREITQILLSYEADINITCKKSMTPLDYYQRSHGNPSDRIDFDDSYYFFCGGIMRYRLRQELSGLPGRIIMMKALDLYVSEKNLKAVDLRKHRFNLEKCQREVAKMKNTKIGDSNVSFYDVATRCVNLLAIHARNESIVTALESRDYYSEFPTYGSMIERRFRLGHKRERLLCTSMKSLTSLTGYALPDICTIELFNYLSNRNLENLIKASNPQHPREININFTCCEKPQCLQVKKRRRKYLNVPQTPFYSRLTAG